MRDYSKVSPRVWESEKFWSLENDLHRYAYLYLLACPHVNSCGCFKLPISYMADDLRWDLEASRKAIDSLCHSLLIAYDNTTRTVWITRWFDFNPPTNPNHGKSILAEIERVSSTDLKIQCLEGLKAFMERRGFKDSRVFLQSVDSLLIAYRKGSATETETETQTKTETQTETKPKLKQFSTEQEEGPSPAQQAAGEPDGPPPVAEPSECTTDIPDLPEFLRQPPTGNVHHLQTKLIDSVSEEDLENLPETKPAKGWSTA